MLITVELTTQKLFLAVQDQAKKNNVFVQKV